MSITQFNYEAVLRNWELQGFAGGLWIDPPGTCWEEYMHDKDELFMVLEGQVELEIDGKIIHPAPGEEILIPAKACHSVRNLGNSTSYWIYAYKKAHEQEEAA